MPELPEVETIARRLRDGGAGEPPILGEQIRAADLFWERTLAEPRPEDFRLRLPGQRIEQVGRRGKFLILRLTEDGLLIHLRMSGDLRVEPEAQVLQTHDRAVLTFDSGLRLVFNDPRKFGRMWLTPDPATVTGGLGPEPFDEVFTADWLAGELAGRQRQIKPLLLDQGFIAGLGNIYSDEALHQAGIHPLTRSDRISTQRAAALWAAIRAVLEEGIRRNGASIDWVYRGGDFQNHFRVYGRTGQPCRVCATPVERRIIGQRSSHYCPVCQPEQREARLQDE